MKALVNQIKNKNRFSKNSLNRRIPAATAKLKNYCGFFCGLKRDPKIVFKQTLTLGIRGTCVGLFLSFASFLNLALAQTPVLDTQQLTVVPTRAVEPLQILVRSETEDDTFSGEILSRRPLHASILQFTFLDENDGVVWRDTVNLPKTAQRIMPFYFPVVGYDETLFLSVEAYDDFGNTAGSGHKYITGPGKNRSVKITDSEVFLDDTSTLNFNVIIENGALAQSYIPQVKIYQGLEHFGDLAQSFDEPAFSLDPKARTSLAFTQPFNDVAGVYEIVVTLLDARNREPVSASFYQQIYKPGDFFKVIDLESYYTSPDRSKAKLEFSGLSTVVLTEPVKMQVKLQHQQNIFLDQTFSLALQPGYFTKSIELNLPAYVKNLSGSASFFLKGKKIQTVNFESDQPIVQTTKQEDLKVPAVKNEIGPVVLREGPKWVFTNQQMLIVVSVCTFLLILIIVISWAKNRYLGWVLVLLGGGNMALSSAWALTVGRDVFPMVEWSNPIPEDSLVFNPTSETGFQWFPVKGRVFNYLTQTALLKGDDFEAVRFNLVSPSGRGYQFQLDESFLKPGTTIYNNSRSGEYYFVLDLDLLAKAEVIGRDDSLIWEDGKWQLQLIFPYQQKNQDKLYLATPLETFGTFVTDQQPPLWQWQLKNSKGGLLSESDFTNEPIRVELKCTDKGSKCISDSQSFTLQGNFCADGLACNSTAARDFVMCDAAGNCATEEIVIQGYDPVPPKLESFFLGTGSTLKASEEIPLSLRYSDPNKVDTNTFKTAFDTSMCGDNNPHFRFNTVDGLCEQRTSACVLVSQQNVWRGDAFNGECVPQCPTGYQFIKGSCQTVCGNAAFKQDRLCLPFNLKKDEA